MMSYGDPSLQPWALSEAEAEPLVRAAVESGVTLFDTADMYSDGVSEEITGRLLAKMFAHRDDYVLATKVYDPTGPGPNDRGLARQHILSAIDASLRRLGTVYVDLYQIHRFDSCTPVEETCRSSMISSGRASSATSAPRRCTPGSWPNSSTCADANGWTRFAAMQDRL